MEKLILNQIIRELLKDAFNFCKVKYYFKIENKFNVKITRYEAKDNITHIKSHYLQNVKWVNIIIYYEEYKEEIRKSLIDNFYKEE